MDDYVAGIIKSWCNKSQVSKHSIPMEDEMWMYLTRTYESVKSELKSYALDFSEILVFLWVLFGHPQ